MKIASIHGYLIFELNQKKQYRFCQTLTLCENSRENFLLLTPPSPNVTTRLSFFYQKPPSMLKSKHFYAPKGDNRYKNKKTSL